MPRPAFLLSLTLCLGLVTNAAPPGRGHKLGTPQDEEALKPAPVAPRPRSDAALLRGLLWAFEPAPPEVRVRAIEDLGLLGDPRTLNPLASLTSDPNPAFALAAVRAIGLQRHPRAEEILSNLVRFAFVPEPTKLLAIDLLPMQGTASALRFLSQVSTSAGASPAVRGRARTALERTGARATR